MQPHKSQWLVPERVVLVRLWGQVHAEDVATLGDDITHYLEESTASHVYVIMNDSEVVEGPSIKESVKFSRTLKHKRLEEIITIGTETNYMTRFMTSIVSQVLNIRMRRLHTLPEAIEYCKRLDSSIDWSQMNAITVGGDMTV